MRGVRQDNDVETVRIPRAEEVSSKGHACLTRSAAFLRHQVALVVARQLLSAAPACATAAAGGPDCS